MNFLSAPTFINLTCIVVIVPSLYLDLGCGPCCSEEMSSLCLPSSPALFSWDDVHLRQRRRPHYIQMASQWETKYQDRQVNCGLQHLPERRNLGQDWQCTWSRWLPHAAHSKFSHTLCMVTFYFIIFSILFSNKCAMLLLWVAHKLERKWKYGIHETKPLGSLLRTNTSFLPKWLNRSIASGS